MQMFVLRDRKSGTMNVARPANAGTGQIIVCGFFLSHSPATGTLKLVSLGQPFINPPSCPGESCGKFKVGELDLLNIQCSSHPLVISEETLQ